MKKRRAKRIKTVHFDGEINHVINECEEAKNKALVIWMIDVIVKATLNELYKDE